MAALKLLLPPPFSRDANQPPAFCLMGADSISQGAHLLPGSFIKSARAAGDLREGGAAEQGGVAGRGMEVSGRGI